MLKKLSQHMGNADQPQSQVSARNVAHYINMFSTRDGGAPLLDMNPAYCPEAPAWNSETELGFLKNWFAGLPTGTIVVSDRMLSSAWPRAQDGVSAAGGFDSAIIDGRQRLSTIFQWVFGKISVPSDWFEEGELVGKNFGGVFFKDVSPPVQRRMVHSPTLNVSTVFFDCYSSEAELYFSLNSGVFRAIANAQA